MKENNNNNIDIGRIMKKVNGKFVSELMNKDKLINCNWHSFTILIISRGVFSYSIQLDSNGNSIENGKITSPKKQWNCKPVVIKYPCLNKTIIFDTYKNQDVSYGGCNGISMFINILLHQFFKKMKLEIPKINKLINDIGMQPRTKGKQIYRRKLDNIINPIIKNIELYLNKIIPMIIKGDNDYWNDLSNKNIWVQYKSSAGYVPDAKIVRQARRSMLYK